jgi:hypothetical protein
MKSMLGGRLILSLFLFAAGSAYASPSGLLYIDDSNGNIGTVNLAIGDVSLLGNSGKSLTDIGFTSDGNLYGTTFTDFYSINKSTGAASLIASYGSVGASGMNALVGSGAGLYAASTVTSDLYAIDPSPFSITALTGVTGGASAGDLAFALSGGSLYESLANGNLDKINISGSTISSTIVGNMGNDTVFGLATGADGVTYAVSGTQIYTVNLNTAVLTPFLDYSGHGLGSANGTAFITEGTLPVSEPGSFSLLAAGLLGLMLYRGRACSERGQPFTCDIEAESSLVMDLPPAAAPRCATSRPRLSPRNILVIHLPLAPSFISI